MDVPNPIANTTGDSLISHHPYYPVGAAVKYYLPNAVSPVVLVAIFASACAALFLLTTVIVSRVRPGMSSGQRLTTFWFVLCGCIHFFFEGYFSRNFKFMPSQTDLFGQLWKEYSLSDSRYMTQDPFTVCMETVTAFAWGPLSFYCVYAILADSTFRYPVQLVVSLGQLYGTVLYYSIYWFDEVVNGFGYSRPEGFYYWAYFIFCNSFWIVIPLLIIVQSAREVSAEFAKNSKAVNGAVKKSQ